MDDKVKKPGRKPRQKKEDLIKSPEIEVNQLGDNEETKQELQSPKVAEVKTDRPVKELPKVETRKRTEHLVYVNGTPRYISRATYETLRKDPKRFTIELPKDSLLVDPELPEPCKNCG